MNTRIQPRHGLRFAGRVAAVSAGLLALAMGAPATAQAELGHRLDVGEPVRTTPLVDDCSLRAPCSQVPGVGAGREPQLAPPKSFDAFDDDRGVGSSGHGDGTDTEDPASVRRTHLWSYAENGVLELRVGGVIHRHRPPPR